jgi:hypothetical protein
MIATMEVIIQNGGYGRTCLTLDPMGKMFQNASSLKTNCPGMIIILCEFIVLMGEDFISW